MQTQRPATSIPNINCDTNTPEGFLTNRMGSEPRLLTAPCNNKSMSWDYVQNDWDRQHITFDNIVCPRAGNQYLRLD